MCVDTWLREGGTVSVRPCVHTQSNGRGPTTTTHSEPRVSCAKVAEHGRAPARTDPGAPCRGPGGTRCGVRWVPCARRHRTPAQPDVHRAPNPRRRGGPTDADCVPAPLPCRDEFRVAPYERVQDHEVHVAVHLTIDPSALVPRASRHSTVPLYPSTQEGCTYPVRDPLPWQVRTLDAFHHFRGRRVRARANDDEVFTQRAPSSSSCRRASACPTASSTYPIASSTSPRHARPIHPCPNKTTTINPTRMRLVVALVLLGLSCTAAVADTDEVCYVGTENIPPWEKEARMQRMLWDLLLRGEDYYASKWNQHDDLHRRSHGEVRCPSRRRGCRMPEKLEASHKKMIVSLIRLRPCHRSNDFNYAKVLHVTLFIPRVCLCPL